MANAATVAQSRTQSGIHAVNRPLAVQLLRSGSGFHLACSECGRTIARNLRDTHDVCSRTELIGRHRMECRGAGRPWMRRMIRLFAVS